MSTHHVALLPQDGEDFLENMARILEGAEELIVGEGLLGRPACAAAVGALRGWASRPDAALHYAVACVEGVRPGPDGSSLL